RPKRRPVAKAQVHHQTPCGRSPHLQFLFPHDTHLNAAIHRCPALPLEAAQDEAPSPVVMEATLPPSEKPVVAVADSASVQIETGVSSLVEESITASPGTVPHNTIDGSSSSFPFGWEKSVAGAADSSSQQVVQKRDVSYSEELFDAPSTEETVIASPGAVPHETFDVSSSSFPFIYEKLVTDTSESASAQTLHELDVSFLDRSLDSSPEESITAGRQAEPHSPTDASPITFPFRCEKQVPGAVESASAQPLQKPDLSSLEEFLDTTSEESMTSGPQTGPHNTNANSATSPFSLGSMIFIRSPANWYEVFYVRVDRGGSFYMYPDHLGGPFVSMDDVDTAIDRYISELQRGGCKEQDNSNIVDRMARNYKYYLDGRTPRRGPNSPKFDGKRYLVQALLDQYSDEHNLLGNLELEDIVMRREIYEDERSFYHFNFRTKKKEGDDNPSAGKLFFAEVACIGDAWEVSCCCMLRDEDDGWCYGCRNNGSPDMKHPKNCHAYYGGHLDEYLPFECEESSSSEDEEDKEIRLRNMFQGLDDPHLWDYLFPNTRSVKVEDF
ncbi:hypothetical protein U9M48_029955, partial [Paspalum notatum var. saurae]